MFKIDNIGRRDFLNGFRLPRTAGAATSFWASLSHHFARRAAFARLRELDDDALKDIGLASWEIEAAVYGRMTARNWTRAG